MQNLEKPKQINQINKSSYYRSTTWTIQDIVLAYVRKVFVDFEAP